MNEWSVSESSVVKPSLANHWPRCTHWVCRQSLTDWSLTTHRLWRESEVCFTLNAFDWTPPRIGLINTCGRLTYYKCGSITLPQYILCLMLLCLMLVSYEEVVNEGQDHSLRWTWTQTSDISRLMIKLVRLPDATNCICFTTTILCMTPSVCTEALYNNSICNFYFHFNWGLCNVSNITVTYNNLQHYWSSLPSLPTCLE